MSGYDASIRVSTKIDNADLKKVEPEVHETAKKMADSMEEVGHVVDNVQQRIKAQEGSWDSLTHKAEDYKTRLKALEDKGFGFGDENYDEMYIAWQNAEHALKKYKETLNQKTDRALEQQASEVVKEQEKQVTESVKVANGFDKIKESCTGLFKKLNDGSKKTSKLFSTLKSRLNGIALSLLVFNWITKGFNAMVSAMKDGFKNLAQYSSRYNDAMSDLKSRCAELKNSLAVAFEPVASAIIPWITQLISWLNTAVSSITRFLAVISGKSSYTRAKKQVIDYAKSLDTASKSAKGALAAFDSINVLSKNEGGNAGGESAGADAFEEVQVTEKDFEWLELVKQKLHEIIGLLMGIGIALAVFGVGGKILGFVAILVLILGLLEFIVQYMDAWANGVSFDNLKGMLQGLLAVFLAIWVLFGPIAAGFVLMAGSIALVVLAIKDMLENGINAENSFLLLIGVIGLLIGIFMVFGSTVATVVAVIILIIGIFAAMIEMCGNGEEAIATLKSMFKNFADFFKKIFAGDVEGAMESLKAAGKDLVNVLIIAFESLINCIIKGLNWLIEKINSISFDVPDWVPIIGGQTLSPNIPTIKEVTIPRLAEGAVIPGGKPFTAILGDQPYGQTNIETPLPTMVDAFRQAMGEGGSNRPIYMQIDGKTFAKLQMPYLKQEDSRVGVSFRTT